MSTCVPNTQVKKNPFTIISEVPLHKPIPFPLTSKADTMCIIHLYFLIFPTYISICKQYIAYFCMFNVKYIYKVYILEIMLKVATVFHYMLYYSFFSPFYSDDLRAVVSVSYYEQTCCEHSCTYLLV